ncbi:MAG: 30S ribosomal protein S20 [Deltaproteobacteria bacterium]|nr:30S ribosomal protein S20 [Deltaproteobacteria bacterium]
MAHHKDAIKRNKQNETRRLRNRHYRTRMRNQIKNVRAAIEAKDVETAQTQLKEAMSVIMHVAGKGVIHRNQASRRVARLNAAVKALVQQA